MDYKQTSQEIISWIKQIVYGAGFKRVVVGVSGGIDSSLVATLCVQALGMDNVFPVLLPYGQQQEAVEDALLVINWLGIPKENILQFDIKDSVDVIANTVILHAPPAGGEGSSQEDSSLSVQNDKIRRGNSIARVRMIYLFDTAKKLSALVCGTENKTEHLLGYFTRFGDGASDIEPIIALYKTQVVVMAKTLGIPERICTKAPSAGLWEHQTDEGEFGFTYIDADSILHYIVDQQLTQEQVEEKGIEKALIEKVLSRVKANAFKHKTPYVYK